VHLKINATSFDALTCYRCDQKLKIVQKSFH